MQELRRQLASSEDCIQRGHAAPLHSTAPRAAAVSNHKWAEPARGMKLTEVVPWGRTMHEYIRMFMLMPEDLRKKIADVGGGPASFNAELTARGGRVASFDPVYQFRPAEIAARIEEVKPVVLEGLRTSMERYHWDEFASVEAVGQRRMGAMQAFLTDYETERQHGATGRYRAESLPWLDAATGEFELALCSHLLFLYSTVLDLEFHRAALRELLRIAPEVRIFPLVNLDGSPSPHLDPIVGELCAAGHDVTIRPVNYRFQRGAEHMLVVKRA